jgi:hypothetical protein
VTFYIARERFSLAQRIRACHPMRAFGKSLRINHNHQKASTDQSPWLYGYLAANCISFHPG